MNINYHERETFLKRTHALLWLISANLVWGTTYVVAKTAMETIPPAVLIALRMTLATALLWTVLWWQNRRFLNQPNPLTMKLGDLKRTLALGFFGLSLGYLLGYFGLNLTTATDASLMIIGEVIFTALFAAWLAGERIGRWQALGMGLGAVGVVVLVLSNITDSDANRSGLWRAVGDLLVLGGICTQAIYSVVGAALSRRYPPLTMVAYAYAGSLLLWLPLLAWYLFAGQFPAIQPTAALGVLYLAIFPSVVCFVIWFSVIRSTGASLGAISLFVQPVVGALLGIFLLDDPVTTGLIVGGGLIFVALYLTTLPDRRAVVDAPASSAVQS